MNPSDQVFNINAPEYVEYTVENFMKLNFCEIADGEDRNLKYSDLYFPILMSYYDIVEDRVSILRYGDIVYLINNIRNSNMFGPPSQAEGFHLFTCKSCANTLLSARKNVMPVAMFLNLTFRQFYDCLEAVSENNIAVHKSRRRAVMDLVNVYAGLDKRFTEEDTLQNVLETAKTAALSAWRPETTPISAFEERIYSAHRCFIEILINSFIATFGDNRSLSLVLYEYAYNPELPEDWYQFEDPTDNINPEGGNQNG